MSEISKTIRTYRIDGNPQADVLYDVFAMWADEVAHLEAENERLRELAEQLVYIEDMGDLKYIVEHFAALLEGKDGEASDE